MKINVIIFSLFLFFIQSAYSQDVIEGDWYLVTKNNYRLIKITNDSIFNHTMEGFKITDHALLNPNKALEIIEKKKRRR